MIPTWSESYDQGFALQNGGFYLDINDYVDLTTRGDIYTKGGWGIENGVWLYQEI